MCDGAAQWDDTGVIAINEAPFVYRDLGFGRLVDTRKGQRIAVEIVTGILQLLAIASVLASVLVWCALIMARRVAALPDDNEPSP